MAPVDGRSAFAAAPVAASAASAAAPVAALGDVEQRCFATAASVEEARAGSVESPCEQTAAGSEEDAGADQQDEVCARNCFAGWLFCGGCASNTPMKP